MAFTTNAIVNERHGSFSSIHPAIEFLQNTRRDLRAECCYASLRRRVEAWAFQFNSLQFEQRFHDSSHSRIQRKGRAARPTRLDNPLLSKGLARFPLRRLSIQKRRSWAFVHSLHLSSAACARPPVQAQRIRICGAEALSCAGQLHKRLVLSGVRHGRVLSRSHPGGEKVVVCDWVVAARHPMRPARNGPRPYAGAVRRSSGGGRRVSLAGAHVFQADSEREISLSVAKLWTAWADA
jgi:hypothetical protein